MPDAAGRANRTSRNAGKAVDTLHPESPATAAQLPIPRRRACAAGSSGHAAAAGPSRDVGVGSGVGIRAPPTRVTRRAATDAARLCGALALDVFSSPDILRVILPSLDISTFVALRQSCRAFRACSTQCCTELIAVLQTAAEVYITPHFGEALALASSNQPHLGRALTLALMTNLMTNLIIRRTTSLMIDLSISNILTLILSLIPSPSIALSITLIINQSQRDRNPNPNCEPNQGSSKLHPPCLSARRLAVVDACAGHRFRRPLR